MNVLVTGSGGFVGRHLGRALRAAGHDVLEHSGPETPGGVDITDSDAVRAMLETRSPDAVIHLAAVSSVSESHRSAARTFSVNVLGTVNLLTAVRTACPNARVLVVGSGEVYGSTLNASPTKEDTLLAPLSPYAASKASAEIAALQFHRTYGTDVVCIRPFSHLGAGQSTAFVVPSFAVQIAAIVRGEAEPVIRVGDLSPVRDFLHVSDVVAAYELLLREGLAGGVYNVASGQGRTVRSLLDELLGLAAVSVRVEVDPARVRPIEIPSMIGDAARLRLLGWTAKRDVRTALRDVLEEHGAL